MASTNRRCSKHCDRPVIGACPGYGRICSAWFCAEHARDGLCAECAAHIEYDDRLIALYRSYEAQARRIDALKPSPSIHNLISMLLCFGPIWLRRSGVLDSFLAPASWLWILLPLAALFANLWVLSRRERPFDAARAELLGADPRFAEFYWSRGRRDSMRRLLQLVELGQGEGCDAWDPARILAELKARPAD